MIVRTLVRLILNKLITRLCTRFQHTSTTFDTLTGSTPTNRRYNVNAMSIFSQACLDILKGNGQKLATRVGQLVDEVNTAFSSEETKGVKSSLCGNFADDLKNIATNIITLANRFTLDRLPIASSITVKVNRSSYAKCRHQPAS